MLWIMRVFETSTQPKVSIIISTYNGSKFISETVESILKQTYTNWELIIVDDGSEDETVQIIEQLKDERIRLYKAGRIGINGVIKNIGLSKATGGLIAFIDHDDLWLPTKLEKQVFALQKYTQAGFCLCNGYNFKVQNEPINYFYRQKEGIKFDNIFFSFFQSEISPWTQTLLVRKECILETGGFNESTFFADPEFIVNLSLHYKTVLLYEPLVSHRLHNESYSVANWIQCHEQGLSIIRRYKKARQLPVAIARNALFRSHINFGEKYLLHKKAGKAIQQFFYAWKNKTNSLAPVKKMVKAILYSFKFFPGQLN